MSKSDRYCVVHNKHGYHCRGLLTEAQVKTAIDQAVCDERLLFPGDITATCLDDGRWHVVVPNKHGGQIATNTDSAGLLDHYRLWVQVHLAEHYNHHQFFKEKQMSNLKEGQRGVADILDMLMRVIASLLPNVTTTPENEEKATLAAKKRLCAWINNVDTTAEDMDVASTKYDTFYTAELAKTRTKIDTSRYDTLMKEAQALRLELDILGDEAMRPKVHALQQKIAAL